MPIPPPPSFSRMRKCEMNCGIITRGAACFWEAILGRGRYQVKRRQLQVLAFLLECPPCVRAPDSLTPCLLALLQVPCRGDACQQIHAAKRLGRSERGWKCALFFSQSKRTTIWLQECCASVGSLWQRNDGGQFHAEINASSTDVYRCAS